MVFKVTASVLFCTCLVFSSSSQTSSYDSLKNEIIRLDTRIKTVELNLETSQRKFQSSILVATLGYTTTIAGGMMLGRKNDEAGQVLLIVGGTTGIIGTYKMVDAFRFLTGKKKKKR